MMDLNALAPTTVSTTALREKAALASSDPKIVLYSHDTSGLGNIRRTLLLSQELTKQHPRASV